MACVGHPAPAGVRSRRRAEPEGEHADQGHDRRRHVEGPVGPSPGTPAWRGSAPPPARCPRTSGPTPMHASPAPTSAAACDISAVVAGKSSAVPIGTNGMMSAERPEAGHAGYSSQPDDQAGRVPMRMAHDSPIRSTIGPEEDRAHHQRRARRRRGRRSRSSSRSPRTRAAEIERQHRGQSGEGEHPDGVDPDEPGHGGPCGCGTPATPRARPASGVGSDRPACGSRAGSARRRPR